MQLTSFEEAIKPRYAILSHTWGTNELSFQEFQRGVRAKEGFKKIEYARKQAKRDNLQYVWADVCCIDKSNSTELAEAINSMYKWYKDADVCYAYLDDVDVQHFNTDFKNSRWFTRGWTLQELIAPRKVDFYGVNWKPLGSKQTLINDLVRITRINRGGLEGEDLNKISIAQRMSWAANRKTTRLEDEAYCLLGIFNVHMPMMYGQGKAAFIRLQIEILQNNDDQSLFCWGIQPPLRTIHPSKIAMSRRQTRPHMVCVTESCDPGRSENNTLHSMFASSPGCFKHCGGIDKIKNWLGNDIPHPTYSSRELRLTIPILKYEGSLSGRCIAILGCWDKSRQSVIGIIFEWRRGRSARLTEPIGIPLLQTVLDDYWILRSNLGLISFTDEEESPVGAIRVLIDSTSAFAQGYKLNCFFCSHGKQGCNCNAKELEYTPYEEGRRAIFLYHSPQFPPFWVLVGKFVGDFSDVDIYTHTPHLRSRSVLRAGFFTHDDGIRFRQEEGWFNPKIPGDINIFGEDEKNVEKSSQQSWRALHTIKQLSNICTGQDDYVDKGEGSGTYELHQWRRHVKVLDTSSHICLSARLKRRAIPKAENCALEETLIISVSKNPEYGRSKL